MKTWEYTTLMLRIVHQREKASGYFSQHNLNRSLDDESEEALKAIGKQGWELVSVITLPHAGAGPGPDAAIAFFKRPLDEAKG